MGENSLRIQIQAISENYGINHRMIVFEKVGGHWVVQDIFVFELVKDLFEFMDLIYSLDAKPKIEGVCVAAQAKERI